MLLVWLCRSNIVLVVRTHSAHGKDGKISFGEFAKVLKADECANELQMIAALGKYIDGLASKKRKAP